MSYSIQSPCFNGEVECVKSEKCTDRHFIQGAVSGIHNMMGSDEFGHMGAGVIKHECSNAEYPKVES